MLTTYELMAVGIQFPITSFQPQLAICTGANMPWAEDHFRERVSGQPLNPPPSEAWWPYAVQGNAEHKSQEKFSHTYPERFWPKYAEGGQRFANGSPSYAPHRGVRYEYGDLNDVVALLQVDPGTRQAYLPVWFPEDTGATVGQRVPCTLGYQFLWRDKLHIIYHIRSCDFMRHWRDDVYMAGRLLQWVSEKLGASPGTVTMNIGSLHIFENDRVPLQLKYEQSLERINRVISQRLMNSL